MVHLLKVILSLLCIKYWETIQGIILINIRSKINIYTQKITLEEASAVTAEITVGLCF
jgi:hypothetical protein